MSHPRPSTKMREASYPPGFPEGWYRVASSDELGPGETKYIECLGKQIVVYRSQDGSSVHAMSAFCPHLGANLAGGCVKGERIECPFHRWQLDPDGRVGHIPYADKLPVRARQETWPICERYQQIFVYYRQGQNSREHAPPYAIPPIPEVEEGQMVYRGSHDAKSVHMHLIEFAENSVDFAHFEPIHSDMFVPWTRFKIPGIKVQYEADWETDPDQAHIAYFKNRSVLHILGRHVDKTRANALITFIGPGSVVTFRFTIPELGDIVMFQTHLPLHPMEQQVNFVWYADKSIPRPLVSYVVGSWVAQWAGDIDIWENKVYRDKPVLAKGDGPIHRMRHWYRQFYPTMAGDEGDVGEAAAAS